MSINDAAAVPCSTSLSDKDCDNIDSTLRGDVDCDTSDSINRGDADEENYNDIDSNYSNNIVDFGVDLIVESNDSVTELTILESTTDSSNGNESFHTVCSETSDKPDPPPPNK